MPAEVQSQSHIPQSKCPPVNIPIELLQRPLRHTTLNQLPRILHDGQYYYGLLPSPCYVYVETYLVVMIRQYTSL